MYKESIKSKNPTRSQAAATLIVFLSLPAISHATIVVDAGEDQIVSVMDLVQLEGSAYDTEGIVTEFYYYWELTSIPSGASANLSNAYISNPTIVADLLGDYNLSFLAAAGSEVSEPDTVLVTATPEPATLALLLVGGLAVLGRRHGQG